MQEKKRRPPAPMGHQIELVLKGSVQPSPSAPPNLQRKAGGHGGGGDGGDDGVGDDAKETRTLELARRSRWRKREGEGGRGRERESGHRTDGTCRPWTQNLRKDLLPVWAG